MATTTARQRVTATAVIPDIMDLDITIAFEGQVRISHEAAALLLPEFNRGNRRKRGNLVEYLLRQVENDEWQPDHPQPIVFSDAGRLIDGQHRLEAIAESGRTVVARVLCGVRDGLREYIDTGISRQLEDRVTFSPDLTENKRIAVLLNQWRSLDGNRPRGKVTPAEAMNLFVAHRAALLFASGYMGRKQRGVTSAPVMVALAQFWERDAERAEQFADALMSPDGDVQPARRLREHVISLSGKGLTSGATARLALYLRSVGAMKAHMEGRTVAALRNASW
jgi:hypothetical protein